MSNLNYARRHLKTSAEFHDNHLPCSTLASTHIQTSHATPYHLGRQKKDGNRSCPNPWRTLLLKHSALEPSYIVGGNLNWCSHSGKQYGGFSETKNRTALWPTNSTPRCISEKKQTKQILKDTYIPMFLAALRVIAKIWKKPNSLSTDKWVKMSRVCTYDGILCSH